MASDLQMIKDYEAGINLHMESVNINKAEFDEPKDFDMSREDIFKDLEDGDECMFNFDEIKKELKPISWREFTSYSENERRWYLTELIKRFEVPQKEISLYMTGNDRTLSSYVSRKGPKGCFKRKNGKYIWDPDKKEAWFKFIGKDLDEAKTENEYKEYSVYKCNESLEKIKDKPVSDDKLYLKGSGKMLLKVMTLAMQTHKEYEITFKEVK